MKQSKLVSWLDSIGSTATGFLLAIVIQYGVAWWYALPLRAFDNLGIVGIFTVASLVRGFGWRRLMEALHVKRPLSPFMQAVIAERFRQIDVKGYDAENDNALEPGELARAGAAYALAAARFHFGELPLCDAAHPATQAWPWPGEPMKLYGFRDDLARGAALIIADGERNDRTRKRKGGCGDWDHPRPPVTGSGVR